MTHLVNFVAGISSFEFAIDERSRLGDEWTFKSTIEVYLANMILLSAVVQINLIFCFS